ncbi:hypothetical protein J8273_6934 [Carpediemonas membranifera]|uniref:Uncharacterized protein n=1 Tax=Carpediemonas membranifera TaxID=201153 RepID=A0A8J6BUT7_9EUKA|nr:hypothetical protein J8273_6934 [Carpediemonas membranifera]|eukprot:KAG9390696.1 hypothetical protein J8273_6934 [Carpediemonas membranifera]
MVELEIAIKKNRTQSFKKVKKDVDLTQLSPEEFLDTVSEIVTEYSDADGTSLAMKTKSTEYLIIKFAANARNSLSDISATDWSRFQKYATPSVSVYVRSHPTKTAAARREAQQAERQQQLEATRQLHASNRAAIVAAHGSTPINDAALTIWASQMGKNTAITLFNPPDGDLFALYRPGAAPMPVRRNALGTRRPVRPAGQQDILLYVPVPLSRLDEVVAILQRESQGEAPVSPVRPPPPPIASLAFQMRSMSTLSTTMMIKDVYLRLTSKKVSW